MGADDELESGECLPEQGDDSSLPRGMQVKIDLVQQDDAFQFRGVNVFPPFEKGVAQKLGNPGQRCLVAIREPTRGDFELAVINPKLKKTRLKHLGLA